MATHPGMLIAYDNDGNIVATLDHLVKYDDDGNPLGLVNFAEHEELHGEMTDVWQVNQEAGGVDEGTVKGSKVWPEWIGEAAHGFRVELVGPAGRKKIAALVHKESGHRRERVQIEAAIADRIAQAGANPADIRDLVGGPDKHMPIDHEGKTTVRKKTNSPRLPLIARG